MDLREKVLPREKEVTMKECSQLSRSKAASPATTDDIYAVQCKKCFKWRIIPDEEEYEELRSRFTEDPFICNKKPGVSCEDPADINYDATRTWIIDKPNLPKTPKGFKRQLVLRKDFSRLDVYFATPTGKKVRSAPEVVAYINSNPEVKDLCSVSDFSFFVPRVMKETIPENIESNNKMKTPKEASDI